MKKITVHQYENALRNCLSDKQIEVLQIIYYMPNSTAPATELAKVLNPQKPHVLVANGAVGRIGRAFSDYLNFVPGMYGDNKPAYYELVGPWTDKGWAIHKNLKEAMANLKLVTPHNIE